MSGYRLTDEHCAALGLTREQADECEAIARELGPLSQEQRDRLAVLLHEDAPPPLTIPWGA